MSAEERDRDSPEGVDVEESTEGETATAEQAEQQGSEDEDQFQLSLDVEVEDAGPCRKHVRVRVPRSDIDHYRDEAVGELASTAQVPGFRVGRVPQRLVERRFRHEISDQVKQKVLLQSLEQVADDQDFEPINEPDIDVENLEIPEEGDFEYEFDVEVRPEFELPDYKGLTIERPVRDVTDDDVELYLRRFLEQYGQLDPHDGPAEPRDHVVATFEFEHEGKPLRRWEDVTVQLKPVLRFQDAEIEGFDELMAGVRAGETRETEFSISDEADTVEMRGETIRAEITVQEVKRMQLPELNREFLDRVGVDSQEELREQVLDMLERQIRYEQRQSVREQVLEKITESADWELPEDLVRRQTENALRREILEMQQAGFTTREIQARENDLRQHAVSTTRQALKEHFVLDKIAEREEISVDPLEIETEIQIMAVQRGESPRRLRARLNKSGTIENLEAQVRERKAVDVVLDQAEFEEIDMGPVVEDRVEAVSRSVCAPAAQPAPVEEPETEES